MLRVDACVTLDEVTVVSLSFELFPPPAAALTAVNACLDALSALAPRLISVTCGANGTTQGRTVDFVHQVLETHPHLALAPHVTCVGAAREEVLGRIDRYARRGIRHLVLLRGDRIGAPSHPAGDFGHAAELIEGVARAAPGRFEIAVAAYPEGHPEAPGVAADLDNLARKVDAGAHRAITQFCFDTDAIVRYRDHCRARGVQIPIVPGILPVMRFAQLERFAARCGASIPDWLRQAFETDFAAEARRALAVDIAAAQVARLKVEGFVDFHFYTLNEAELSIRICEAAGLAPTREGAAKTPALEGRDGASGEWPVSPVTTARRASGRAA
jgi:methylenetetrahydrofolate reductase (NADPH)